MTDSKNSSKKIVESGNTKQIPQSKKWVMVLNNYTNEEMTKALEFMKEKCKSWIMAEEIAPTTGTKHLQCFVETHKKARPTEFGLVKRWHFEKANGNIRSNIEYCSKEGKYKCSVNVRHMTKLRIITELRPWQEELRKMIEEAPDDRSIIWIYDINGNIGKSAMTKYMVHHYDACLISGKGQDALHHAMEQDSGIYIFDVPRVSTDFISFTALESIKNGCFFSGKYESKQCLRNSPHVIVFANVYPDCSKMSLDRWKIYQVVNNRLVIKAIEIEEEIDVDTPLTPF